MLYAILIIYKAPIINDYCVTEYIYLFHIIHERKRGKEEKGAGLSDGL